MLRHSTVLEHLARVAFFFFLYTYIYTWLEGSPDEFNKCSSFLYCMLALGQVFASSFTLPLTSIAVYYFVVSYKFFFYSHCNGSSRAIMNSASPLPPPARFPSISIDIDQYIVSLYISSMIQLNLSTIHISYFIICVLIYPRMIAEYQNLVHFVPSHA